MEDYEILNEIGKGNYLKGSFGSVFKVKRKKDKEILVWKEVYYGNMSEKEKQQLVTEVNILQELKNTNIVKYCDKYYLYRIIDQSKKKIYIIMEYCKGGDMAQIIRKCIKECTYIQESMIWKIFSQILQAINICHTRKQGKILHRDIKPGNIFLDSYNNAKLGDFGLSKILSIGNCFAQSHVGTPYYMSPELIKENKYNEKCDIWSLGCLIYEMAALKPPFEASTHLLLAKKITLGKFERIPIRYSEDLQSIIEKMLKINQNERPSAELLLKFPFINLRINEHLLKEKYSRLKRQLEQLITKEASLKEEQKQLDKELKLYSSKEQLQVNNSNEKSSRPDTFSSDSTNNSQRDKSSILSSRENIKCNQLLKINSSSLITKEDIHFGDNPNNSFIEKSNILFKKPKLIIRRNEGVLKDKNIIGKTFHKYILKNEESNSISTSNSCEKLKLFKPLNC